MRRSLLLRSNLTVRQTQAILARLERAFGERGLLVERETPGGIVVRTPPPWRLARTGWLALVTRGAVTLSAWGGGPWRLSYRLYFTALQALTAAVTVVMAFLGWGWPRLALLSAVLAVWVVGYGSLHLLAAHAFRVFLREAMADIVERRVRARPASSDTPTASQQPE